MLEDGGYDAADRLLTTVPNTRTLSGPLRKAIAEGCARFPDRLIALQMIADPEIVREYEAAGFLVFEDCDRAVVALAALSRFGAAFEETITEPSIEAAEPIAGTALSEKRGEAGSCPPPGFSLPWTSASPFSAAGVGDAADAIGYPVGAEDRLAPTSSTRRRSAA